ncbi:MAG: sugar phosphate isomerase/epimerase [Clostridia bacterium]|nr:sugar phosphate isomerase/epimerase [Clostridia bacterium]
MAKHTMVSYYGMNYVEHAEKDFIEMKEHGCDTVLLALTEFDLDFWFPNINEIIKTAHKVGLRCIADTWGIGKYFGGEQVSLFLQNNIHHRQVSAYTGEVLNAACFNTNSFRDYFTGLCLKLAKNTEIDGFFWDEPHYAYPKSYASITGGAGDDWACRCPECMRKFEDYYGYEMPKFMNDDVKQFRWREALKTLADCSKALKEYNPNLEITCCVHATMNTYYITELRGYDNWDMVASCPYFDVFSTTIINWSLPESFFRDITERTVAMAKKYGKTVCIEELNSRECNIINTCAEAMGIIRAVNRPEITLLWDFYHTGIEKEPVETIAAYKGYITHAHIASPSNSRAFPRPNDGDDHKTFFDALRKAEYKNERVSIEASEKEGFINASALSLELLRSI